VATQLWGGGGGARQIMSSPCLDLSNFALHSQRSHFKRIEKLGEIGLNRKVCWLHLSDIHFSAVTNWRDDTARKALLQFLGEGIGRTLPVPDLIFCTGDIAFGKLQMQSLQDQYEDARKFLHELRTVVRPHSEPLAKDRLFLVPGNHDVDRSEINRDAQKYLTSLTSSPDENIDEINARIAHGSSEYLNSLDRLKCFSEFLNDVCEHVTLANGHLHYQSTLAINGISLQVVGLNSAWDCSGGESERRLWLGAQAQLAMVDRDHTLKIGLVHHPLGWFTRAEEAFVRSRMGFDLHMLLHGHDHQFRHSDHGADWPIIGAGAVSAETSNEHGVALVEIDLDSRKRTYNVLVYSSQSGRWNPCPDEGNKVRDLPEQFVESAKESWADPNTGYSRLHGFEDDELFLRQFSRISNDFEDDSYDELVETAQAATNRDTTYFRSLWGDAFNHHADDEMPGDPERLKFDSGDSYRLITKDNLDAYFLRQLVVAPQMSATANENHVDIGHKRGSFESFSKAVSDTAVGGTFAKEGNVTGENRVSYLVGDVGVGKTLTVLKMLDNIRESPEDHKGYRTVCVYLDLHQVTVENDAEPNHLFEEVLKRLVAKIRAQLRLRHSHARAATLPNSADAESTLKELCHSLLSEGFAPFFVFDNGDKFYFEDAKYRFFEPYARSRNNRLEHTLIHLVDRFVQPDALGKLGASVLLVCRRYVYVQCRKSFDHIEAVSQIRRDHKVYQVVGLDKDVVTDSRFALLTHACACLKGKYRNAQMFENQVEYVKDRLFRIEQAREHSTLNTIWQLAHQGHRSYLNFLASLPLDIGRPSVTAARLQRTPNVLLLLYLSNMHKKYTQKHGHFPNLFLNDAVISTNPNFQLAHQPHVQTYWLKFLLLRYVDQNSDLPEENHSAAAHGSRALSSRRTVNSERVIKYFCEELHFEDHLVRLALGSLSDPSTAMCIETVRPDPVRENAAILRISRRGRAMVDDKRRGGPFCFSFDYLQLITDDYLMSIPNDFVDDIFVDADLGHLLKETHDYVQGALRTIEKKASAVATFLLLVEQSFNAEIEWRGIEGKLGDLAPDFVLARTETVNSIKRVLSAFDAGEVLLDRIRPDDLFSDDALQNQIRKFFDEYYEQPARVSVH